VASNLNKPILLMAVPGKMRLELISLTRPALEG